MKRWTFTESEMLEMVQAMAAAGLEDLAKRLGEISHAFNSQAWAKPDLAIVEVAPSPQPDEPYIVVDWGDGWMLADNAIVGRRPVGEKVYYHRTHAYRRCRELNEAATANDQHLEAWVEQERERLNERALAEEAHQKRFAEEIQEVLGFNDLPSAGSL